MAVALQVSIEGQKELQRLMARLDPKRQGVRWQRAALLRAGLLVQKTAAQKKIRRGGATRKGSSRPLLGVLTSRTGTLRRSIRVDRGPLPGAIDIGTGLTYGGVHELGGVYGIGRHSVSAHTRNVVFGKRVAAFTVPRHSRGPYSARFPRRPFLAPALEEITPQLPSIFVKEIEKELGTRG